MTMERPLWTIPMTEDEVRELLGSTLHGALPQQSVDRMMTTLGVWADERRTLTLFSKNLETTDLAKLLRPAPEGYKYEVKLVHRAEAEPPVPGYDHTVAANPVPASPFFRSSADPKVVPLAFAVPPELTTREVCDLLETRPQPFDPAKKYEHKGLMCKKHDQQAHRRERNVTGPWACVVCFPSTE